MWVGLADLYDRFYALLVADMRRQYALSWEGFLSLDAEEFIYLVRGLQSPSAFHAAVSRHAATVKAKAASVEDLAAKVQAHQRLRGGKHVR